MITRQTRSRTKDDSTRRLSLSRPAMFEEDVLNKPGATYPSERISPLNVIQAKRSSFFHVGFHITHRRVVRSLVPRSSCRKKWFSYISHRGRTGFDSSLEAQAACRGWFVGLVKNRTKQNKRRSRRSRSRGLIDRDVFAATPASGGNGDSRLANRRSDRDRFVRSTSRTLGSRQCAGTVFGSLKLETG